MNLTSNSYFKYIYPAIPPALWGIGIGVAKYLLSNYKIDNISLTYTRFLFTALLMTPLILYLIIKSSYKTSEHPNDKILSLINKIDFKKGILFIIGVGITGVAVNNFIFYYGLNFTFASDAALIVGMSPIISIILASIFVNHSIKRNQIIGSIIGLLGVALMIGFAFVNFNFQRFLGDIIVLTAITLWSSSFIFSKKASELNYSAIAITYYSITLAVIFMTPGIIILGTGSLITNLIINDPIFLLGMLYFGLLSGAIGYSLWYGNIHKMGAVETAIFLDSMPFWTIIFSIIFLHETLSYFHIIGLVLISFGVIIVNKEKKPAKIVNISKDLVNDVSVN